MRPFGQIGKTYNCGFLPNAACSQADLSLQLHQESRKAERRHVDMEGPAAQRGTRPSQHTPMKCPPTPTPPNARMMASEANGQSTTACTTLSIPPPLRNLSATSTRVHPESLASLPPYPHEAPWVAIVFAEERVGGEGVVDGAAAERRWHRAKVFPGGGSPSLSSFLLAVVCGWGFRKDRMFWQHACNSCLWLLPPPLLPLKTVVKRPFEERNCA